VQSSQLSSYGRVQRFGTDDGPNAHRELARSPVGLILIVTALGSRVRKGGSSG
jgi:hypothetical protein